MESKEEKCDVLKLRANLEKTFRIILETDKYPKQQQFYDLLVLIACYRNEMRIKEEYKGVWD